MSETDKAREALEAYVQRYGWKDGETGQLLPVKHQDEPISLMMSALSAFSLSPMRDGAGLRICTGCGSTLTDEEIKAGGWRGCCPERKMVPLRDALQDRWREGILQAAKFVEKRRDAYHNEHGSYDPSTGAWKYPGTGDEYVGELEEIEEAIRALATPEKADE